MKVVRFACPSCPKEFKEVSDKQDQLNYEEEIVYKYCSNCLRKLPPEVVTLLSKVSPGSLEYKNLVKRLEVTRV